MAVNKPFYRTCRPFTDGTYFPKGEALYRLDANYAEYPEQYVRAFLYLQQDLLELLAYVEPADDNLTTFSHRIQQFLMRTCVEVEANLAAILTQNGYQEQKENKRKEDEQKKNKQKKSECTKGIGQGHLNMSDYRYVNISHHLSSYKVGIPVWQKTAKVWQPFKEWKKEGSLPWYQAYNHSKHNIREALQEATFGNLVEAMCGLAVLISSQFYDEDYSSSKSLGYRSLNSYQAHDSMQSAIGNFFRVRFPTDWKKAECYDFDWDALKAEDEPFDKFRYQKKEESSCE